jgi:hypothetical protein
MVILAVFFLVGVSLAAAALVISVLFVGGDEEGGDR